MFVESGIGLLGLAMGYLLGRGGGWRGIGKTQRNQRIGDEGLAYIKGVNYLLSDAHDLAIEEFIKAVQINSETVETYLALGSLFRSEGDVTRAIRIHEGIICRPRVEAKIMLQAQYELGLDYKKAGLLDRAIATFLDVIDKNPKMLQAYIQLESLYEEVKEWEAAFRTQEKISKLRKSDDRHVLGHLMTEWGKAQLAQGDRKAAKRSFRQAISIHSGCVDAYLHFGDLYAEEGHDTKAVEMWKKVMEVAPSMTFLAYDRLEHAFFRMGKVGALEKLLRGRGVGKEADLVTRLFLGKHLRKKGELEESVQVLRGVLDQWPDSREARQELIQVLRAQGNNEEALEEYERLLQCLPLEDHYFQCQRCGYQGAHLLWKCPQCHQWDTIRQGREGPPDGAEER